MFCPKCAAQNIEDASYCRVCGANISLVPQALNGKLPSKADPSHVGGVNAGKPAAKEAEPNIESAVTTIGTGVAFVVIAIVLAFSAVGYGWWFWLLIPGFSLLGSGIAKSIKYRDFRSRSLERTSRLPPSFQDHVPPGSLSQANTSELAEAPASVTEGTTRHLGVEVPTRHLDS
jgi:hypothetical protein